MRHYWPICVVLILVVQSCASSRYVIPENNRMDLRNTMGLRTQTKLQAVLDEAIDKYNLAAIQATVIDGNGQIWNGVSGTTDFTKKTNANIGSLFRIASVTKVFTSTVAMRLVETGKLKLSDTVNQWYPIIRNSDKITIKMLLNHTSGFQIPLRTFQRC